MRDQTANTALMLAAQYNHTNVIPYLAPYEAGLENNYQIALERAINNEKPDAVRALLKYERMIVRNHISTDQTDQVTTIVGQFMRETL